jgi:adenylosuccinate lyase
MSIPNVLANRYASAAMRQLWSPEKKIILERRLWIAVLTAQRDLGVDFGGDDPDAVITAYQRVVEKVDLDSIAARERITRHDVKARIEEFNALAGFEHIHKGMTSRDLTENVEQLQIVSALKIIRDRVVTSLVALTRLAAAYAELPMAGRSHNVAAQVTTLGKRFATAADELLVSYARITELIDRYPLRGIKGPVGTSQDMLDLLDGDEAKVAELERRIAAAPEDQRAALGVELSELLAALRAEKIAELATEFDGVHNIHRAVEVGSVDEVITAAELRPKIISVIRGHSS